MDKKNCCYRKIINSANAICHNIHVLYTWVHATWKRPFCKRYAVLNAVWKQNGCSSKPTENPSLTLHSLHGIKQLNDVLQFNKKLFKGRVHSEHLAAHAIRICCVKWQHQTERAAAPGEDFKNRVVHLFRVKLWDFHHYRWIKRWCGLYGRSSRPLQRRNLPSTPVVTIATQTSQSMSYTDSLLISWFVGSQKKIYQMCRTRLGACGSHFQAILNIYKHW